MTTSLLIGRAVQDYQLFIVFYLLHDAVLVILDVHSRDGGVVVEVS